MFKILDYLSKLEIVRESSTHITCVCPVCGDDNFKIVRSGKSKNAYKCWSNYCSSKDIKDRLGVKPSRVPSAERITPIFIIPAEVPYTGTSPVLVPDYIPLKPKVKRFSGGYTMHEIVYPYSSSQRVFRVDNIENKTKQVYIQYKNDDFVWVAGTGPDSWPVYSYGLDDALNESSFDTIVFVEGEKTAEACKQKGIAAITVMAGNFHSGLDKNLLLFSVKFPNIRNVIYVPDADNPGLIKATKVQHSCWRVGLGCKIIPMTEIIEQPFDGMDLADLNDNLFREFADVIRGKQQTSISVSRDSVGLVGV